MKKQTLFALAVSATLGLAACGPGEQPKQKTAAPAGTPRPAPQTMAERTIGAAKQAAQAAGEKADAAAKAADAAADSR